MISYKMAKGSREEAFCAIWGTDNREPQPDRQKK